MKIFATKHFEADIKFYLKRKHFSKINDDVETVTAELEQGNLVGNKLDNLKIPENISVYKVRIANSSINVGKSNGFRLIYYVVIDKKIYLLTIYSKKDDDRIPSDKVIELLVKAALEEKPKEE